jgi:AcrR family transcriptional regulator
VTKVAVAGAEGARREALVAVALQAFSVRAFDEVSMDDVADEAGVAKGLLYYYFGSKRGLYVAAVREAATRLRGRWDADSGAAPVERLAAGIDAYLDYAREHADGYRALIAGGVGTDPEVRALLAEERELVIERVVEGLGLRDAPAPLRVALQGWLSFMEGATLEWLDSGRPGRAKVRAIVLGNLAGMLPVVQQLDPRVPAALGA